MGLTTWQRSLQAAVSLGWLPWRILNRSLASSKRSLSRRQDGYLTPSLRSPRVSSRRFARLDAYRNPVWRHDALWHEDVWQDERVDDPPRRRSCFVQMCAGRVRPTSSSPRHMFTGLLPRSVALATRSAPSVRVGEEMPETAPGAAGAALAGRFPSQRSRWRLLRIGDGDWLSPLRQRHLDVALVLINLETHKNRALPA